MNDIHYLTVGFTILQRYGTSEVNTDGQTIYAGPDDMGLEHFSKADREILEANYWHFNDTIDRWGYTL